MRRRQHVARRRLQRQLHASPSAVTATSTCRRGETCDDGNRRSATAAATTCRVRDRLRQRRGRARRRLRRRRRRSSGDGCSAHLHRRERLRQRHRGGRRALRRRRGRHAARWSLAADQCINGTVCARPLPVRRTTAATAGSAALEECDDGAAELGHAAAAPSDRGRAVHARVRCGDGVKDGAEACDDGNTNPSRRLHQRLHGGRRCAATARPEGSEQCDDGNNVAGDGCSSACTRRDHRVRRRRARRRRAVRRRQHRCRRRLQRELPARGRRAAATAASTSARSATTATPTPATAAARPASSSAAATAQLDTGEQCDDGNNDVGRRLQRVVPHRSGMRARPM